MFNSIRRLQIRRCITLPGDPYRFQPRRQSGLFDFSKGGGNVHDCVLLSGDGLIYPRASTGIPFSNGALFMPNTFMMQELARTLFDQYTENSENEHTAKELAILCVRKGVCIPNSLVLLREDSSRFSLQSSQPILLTDLNRLLDEFYSKHANIITMGEWLDQNEYHKAAADDMSADWMER